jgi:hypothetical protein
VDWADGDKRLAIVATSDMLSAADMSKALWTGGTQSEVEDGATAVAFDFDTDNDLATNGAKLASFKNYGVEKAHIDEEGRGWFGGPSSASSIRLSGGNTQIDFFYNGVLRSSISGVAANQIRFLTSSLIITESDASIIGGPMSNTENEDFLIRPTKPNEIGSWTNLAGNNLVLEGSPAAPKGAGAGKVGGKVSLSGGNGSADGTGDAHGGNVEIAGGTGYGTGHDGYIVMPNLPTADPAVAGALWNDSGTLKVSAG